MIFFTYAFVNMGMVSGILPVVGVPLPFISYGGTAMVTLGLGLGILMSISRAKKLIADQEAFSVECRLEICRARVAPAGEVKHAVRHSWGHNAFR
jgi:hypothetical protein